MITFLVAFANVLGVLYIGYLFISLLFDVLAEVFGWFFSSPYVFVPILVVVALLILI